MTTALETFGTDLATWLAAHGVGTVGTSLFVGEFPPTRTDAVLLIETGGRAGDPARQVDFPSIQVTARGASYAAARTLIHQVHVLLNEPAASIALAGGTVITYAKSLQPPTPLGVDDEGLWRWVCNFRFWLPRR